MCYRFIFNRTPRLEQAKHNPIVYQLYIGLDTNSLVYIKGANKWIAHYTYMNPSPTLGSASGTIPCYNYDEPLR